MKKLLLFLTLLTFTSMTTPVSATHWVPLSRGTNNVPAVLFDTDSLQQSDNTLYFWEKIQNSKDNYQLRLARVNLTDYTFADAEIVQQTPGQNKVFLHPESWTEYGTSLHPLRMVWMDKVLSQLGKAQKIPADISLSQVTPLNF